MLYNNRFNYTAQIIVIIDVIPDFFHLAEYNCNLSRIILEGISLSRVIYSGSLKNRKSYFNICWIMK